MIWRTARTRRRATVSVSRRIRALDKWRLPRDRGLAARQHRPPLPHGRHDEQRHDDHEEEATPASRRALNTRRGAVWATDPPNGAAWARKPSPPALEDPL